MKTILLVDDDEFLRELYGRALRKKGYHVLEADSGIEGFEKALKNLPDLILTDICMPGGDGATLLRNIRNDPELKFTPVVVMSGMPDLLVPSTGTEGGADDFLTKPVSLQELLSCVQARFIQAALLLSCGSSNEILSPRPVTLTPPWCARRGNSRVSKRR